eukprot:7382237-Prymnesium_polylepis.2
MSYGEQAKGGIWAVRHRFASLHAAYVMAWFAALRLDGRRAAQPARRTASQNVWSHYVRVAGSDTTHEWTRCASK